MSDKTQERHYFVRPLIVYRVVGRVKKAEVVGWKYEVQDGHGHLVGVSETVYRKPEEARAAAKEAHP